ncbi:MAG: rhodanese-like domain-containing protein [Fluviicola sp.]
MKSITFILMTLITSTLLGQKNVPSDFNKELQKYYDKDFPTISTKEANKKLNQANVYFLDVREMKEYAVSHLPGAKFYGGDKKNEALLKSIPKNAEIIVYCSIGYRSQKAGQELKKLGYKNVKNLYGGIFQWFNENKKVVNSENEPVQKVHTYNEKWSKWITRGEKVF